MSDKLRFILDGGPESDQYPDTDRSTERAKLDLEHPVSLIPEASRINTIPSDLSLLRNKYPELLGDNGFGRKPKLNFPLEEKGRGDLTILPLPGNPYGDEDYRFYKDPQEEWPVTGYRTTAEILADALIDGPSAGKSGLSDFELAPRSPLLSLVDPKAIAAKRLLDMLAPDSDIKPEAEEPQPLSTPTPLDKRLIEICGTDVAESLREPVEDPGEDLVGATWNQRLIAFHEHTLRKLGTKIFTLGSQADWGVRWEFSVHANPNNVQTQLDALEGDVLADLDALDARLEALQQASH